MTPGDAACVVVSTSGLTEPQAERIRAVSPRVRLTECGGAPEALAPYVGEAEVLLTHFRQTGFDPALAPRLRWAHVTSASVEPIFAQPIAGTSVEITNSSGIHAIPIGEYVLASMLAFARRFRPLLERQQHHHWALPEEIYRSLVGVELRGAVLGIVGYGSIGREVARLGTAFGTRVLACKRDPASRADPGWRPEGVGDPEGSIPEAFFGPSGLHEMLGRSDFVVVTCPLTPETAGLIDAAALATMRPGAYLVNVSRGGIVDEPALIEALRAGRIGGAGLDVTAREPLPAESPLFDLPNVLVTPHCSGTTAAYNDRAVEVFCENLRRHLAGRPLLNRIDRALRY